MKKSIIIIAAILIAGFTTKVMAQGQATVSGTTAGAKIIVPMTLTQSAPLNFGTLLLTGSNGTCILPSNSTARQVSGGLTLSAVAPVATNAAYNVTGTLSTTYALTLPIVPFNITRIGGTETMAISDMTARFNGGAADAVTSTLSAAGTDSFTVGGTLTVDAAQAGGVYTGSFNVTVAYN